MLPLNFGVVIVCRMDSRRLPGKCLREVAGRPVLSYLISRCLRTFEFQGSVAVATTQRTVDDPIADFCARTNVHCHRGPTEDVARRILDCAIEARLQYFARVNGDSPCFDPGLASIACTQAQKHGYDLVTNLRPRSFPYGVAIELLNTRIFRIAYNRMHRHDHFEHVTTFLYEHLSEYRFFNIFQKGALLSTVRLTIDTDSDFRIFEKIIHLAGEDWDTLNYRDLVALRHKAVNLL